MHGLTIVFDLDGTLVDTAPDLVGATNRVLGTFGAAPLPATLLRPWISHGARRMIVEAAVLRRIPMTEAETDRALERFLEHYIANIARESRPFPYAVEALDRLRRRGATLAVCTNKRESWSRLLLDELAMSDRFAAIAGRDTFPVCKPDPGHLTGAIALAGGDPAQAVMVGDSGVDIATARAASIPVIGVSFGYTETPVEDLGPDAVVAHFDQLEAAIDRVWTHPLRPRRVPEQP